VLDRRSGSRNVSRKLKLPGGMPKLSLVELINSRFVFR
jgi:hypothetical protein